MPNIPIAETRAPEPEAMESAEEEVNDDFDISDLGPNPTQQMIDMKRKKMQNKKGVSASPKKAVLTPSSSSTAKKVVPKKVEIPARNEFPGENCAIYLINANIAERSGYSGTLDFTKLQNLVGPDFHGAQLTFIHTPKDWRYEHKYLCGRRGI